MAAKGLTEARRSAEAAKPSDWTIRGVVLGPREVDPRVNGSRWAAWAVGPTVSGSRPKPRALNDALMELAVRLREL